MLLTRIPFFRDIILMAFECDECGFRSSEVQSASMQDKGCRFECRIENTRDMNRQLVKGEKATFSIPELEFEIPSGTQGGVFTTVEGLMDRALENLEQTQPLRRARDAAGADAVDGFVSKLRAYRSGDHFPFTVVLDDPSGNSFLENPVAPQKDPKLKARHYVRSKAQNEALGLFAGNRGLGAIAEEAEDGAEETSAEGQAGGELRALGPDAPIYDEEEVEANDLRGSGAQTVYANRSVDLAGAAVAYAEALAARTGGGAPLSASQAAARARRETGSSSSHAAGQQGDALKQYDEEKAAAAAQLAAEAAAHEALKAKLLSEKARLIAARASEVTGGPGQEGSQGAAAEGGKGKGRDMSGNVPGGFKKGGALIRNETERSSLTQAGRGRSGVQREAGPSGRVASFLFESSASDKEKEVMTFTQPCHSCSAPGDLRMCVTDVPHFKEIILMSFDCDACGWRNVEVKGGGAVPPHGTLTELLYTPGQPWSEDDLIRDVIKGDTAAVAIPELELELDAGSLGGMYTTVEGLMSAIRDKLVEGDPYEDENAAAGDSDHSGHKARMKAFLAAMDACIAGTRAFTLQVRDPMANSWIYTPYAGSGKDDPRLKHSPYTRSHDEDLDLGLLDMNAPRPDEEGEGEQGPQ